MCSIFKVKTVAKLDGTYVCKQSIVATVDTNTRKKVEKGEKKKVSGYDVYNRYS